MPVTEMELNEALSRAAVLMSPEGQRKINAASRNNSGNFNNDGDYIQPSGSHNMRNTVSESRNFKPNAHSGLPKAIQDSIMKTPLDGVMSEYSLSESSVIDDINYQPKTYSKKQESLLYETHSAPVQQYTTLQPPVQQYIPQPQITLDYNYIRSIVNECIQANLNQIKEEILKESSLRAIRIGGENKIQLIDSKNNLYESKLEYKKNLNKK